MIMKDCCKKISKGGATHVNLNGSKITTHCLCDCKLLVKWNCWKCDQTIISVIIKAYLLIKTYLIFQEIGLGGKKKKKKKSNFGVLFHVKSFIYLISDMASQVYEFRVEMTCEGCVNSVQNVLNKQAGVNDINVNLDNKMVSVKTTLSSDEVLQTIKKTGKECTFLGVKQ